MNQNSHNSSLSKGVTLNKLLNIFGLGGGGLIILGSKNSHSISLRLVEPLLVDK